MAFALIGAGGHAKVVLSTLRAAGRTVDGVYDDDESRIGSELLGVPIVGPIDQAAECDEGIIAVGDNRGRRDIAAHLSLAWATVAHPSAVVCDSVVLDPGTVVFAGAVVQVDTVVGAHCIVNTGASIDHDCIIGKFAHIAPGCHLSGAVRLGAGVLMGVGSVAAPTTTVGAWSIVGAGAAVVRPIPPGVVAVGVPARPVIR